MTIVSIGEILWDLFPATQRLGGATFNFSVHARKCGHDVVFLSAVGNDARGHEAIRRAADLGLPPQYIQTVDFPTGRVTVGFDAAGHPDFVMHRPAAYDQVVMTDAVAACKPDWIYYGTLHQIYPHTLEQTRLLIQSAPGARKFYDINLRRDCYTPDLLWQLMEQADVVKLNDTEAAEIDRMAGRPHTSFAEFTAHWSERMNWQAVAITRGADGCSVRVGGTYLEAPSYRIEVADTVGAGDSFSAAFLHGLASDWAPAKCADFANRVGALVASKPGGIPAWTVAEAWSL